MSQDYSLYYVLDLPTDGRNPIELARAAAAGGASMIQLRGKHVGGHVLYELAVALKNVLDPLNIPLIINDRLDVALAADADGVHVGDDDLPCKVVRRVVPGRIVGVSCYGDIEHVRQAAASGATYVAFGAFYTSPTKPEAPVVPLKVLAEARQFGLPVVAIGGITLEHVPELIEAGADGIAVVSAIQRSDDPERAARALRDTLDRRLTLMQRVV